MSDLRILGKRLGQRLGQEAIVLGRITEKSPDGVNAEITTTDDAQINVTFIEPLNSNVSDYIELRGTVKSKSTMSCNNFICFPPSMTKDFVQASEFTIIYLARVPAASLTKVYAIDMNSYNTMVNIRCAVGSQLEGTFYGD